MNSFVRCFFALTALTLGRNAYTADDRLAMTWGLDRPYFYSEVPASLEESAVNQIDEKSQPYRYFTILEHDAAYARRAQPLWERNNYAWETYKESNADRSREAYIEYLKVSDPYILAALRNLAPVLYFDFMGAGESEYVLQAIEVRTIAFVEYAGGGFSDKQAWYDIVLSTKPGAKQYEVGSKLRFRGSGRAELRLWSGNYHPNMNSSPMGCYTIDITFHFLSDGRPTKVATGIFKIDV